MFTNFLLDGKSWKEFIDNDDEVSSYSSGVLFNF